jgi:hypothetical protein
MLVLMRVSMRVWMRGQMERQMEPRTTPQSVLNQASVVWWGEWDEMHMAI